MTDTNANQGQVAVVQDVHPNATGPAGGEDQAPKVVVGDGDAEVGTPGSGAEAAAAGTEHASSVLAAPDGYIGHNPDKTPNDDYTLPGQLAGNAPVEETAPGAGETASDGGTPAQGSSDSGTGTTSA